MLNAARGAVGEHNLQPKVTYQIVRVRDALGRAGLTAGQVDEFLAPVGSVAGADPTPREPLNGAEVVLLAQALGAIPPQV